MESIRMPFYMSQFRCIGASCENSCCAGDWIIAYDMDTVTKCKTCHDPGLTALFEEYLQPEPDLPGFMVIRKLPDGNCPFLNQGLCHIVQRLSPAFLSSVCNTYPRHLNKINGMVEMSGSVSCPEVGRLALLKPDSMSFVQYPASSYLDNRIPLFCKNFKDQLLQFSGQQNVLKFREFTIGILQDSCCPIADRLIFLGLFYQKVQQYIDDSKHHELEKLLAEYSRRFTEKNAKGLTDQISGNLALKLRLLLAMCGVKANSHPSYRAFLGKILTPMRDTPQNEPHLAGDQSNISAGRYQECNRKYLIPLLRDRESVLENYLVNYVFQTVFPFSGTGQWFESYALLIMHYALFKFHFTGMALLKEQVDDSLIIEAFGQYSRFFEHDRATMEKIVQLFRDNHFMTLPYLMVLMKD